MVQQLHVLWTNGSTACNNLHIGRRSTVAGGVEGFLTTHDILGFVRLSYLRSSAGFVYGSRHLEVSYLFRILP